jgi:multimeric flavodoxin WrbA
MKTLTILGSSSSYGDTRQALDYVVEGKEIEFVDLSKLDISYFDYDHKNKEDDFIPLAEKMVEYRSIILAMPVYWYTMSAVMKTFVDRLSDLLSIRKDLGRALKGKWIYVVTSYGGEFPMGFENPFRLTCNYMDMYYGGCYFDYTGKDPNLLEDNLRKQKSFKALVWG